MRNHDRKSTRSGRRDLVPVPPELRAKLIAIGTVNAIRLKIGLSHPDVVELTSPNGLVTRAMLARVERKLAEVAA